MVESARRVVLAAPSPAHESGCSCPGHAEKLDRPPRAEKAEEEAQSAGEPGEPMTDDRDEDNEDDDEEHEARKLARAVEQAAWAQRVSRAAKRLVDAEERGPVDPPGASPLREFLARPRTGPKYRIDGLWPAGGKILITAPKKSGKTTLVGNLIRCLVDGDPFLGAPFTPVHGAPTGYRTTGVDRPVVLLDFEMTESMLVEWLADQQIEKIDLAYVELMRGRRWDIRDDEVRGEWAAFLRSINAGTLIVDPIGPVMHALGIDENSNSEVGGFLAALDALAHDAALDEHAAVHHAGHGEEQRARGASSFLGWPDATWQITRGDGVSFLQAEGRDVALEETELRFDRTTRHLTLGEGNRASTKAAGDVEMVVGFVTDNPGATQRDIVGELKREHQYGQQRAVEAVRAAVKDGHVHTHAGEGRRQHHHLGSACDRCPSLVVG
jgi:hypothetical protein